jgi:ubiquinone biosynthesis protein COQ4
LHSVEDVHAELDPAREVANLLAGRHPRLLARVRQCEEGAELLRDRPVIDPTCALQDLLGLPGGTFGKEYARWMIDQGLSPDQRPTDPLPADPDERYLLQRLLEVHDLWHVLSGYNCDAAGELGMLAFTLGQRVQPRIAWHLLSAIREDLRVCWKNRLGPWTPLIPYLWRAFRRGRKARFLVPIILEDYLYLPIGTVRERLGIVPLRRSLSRALPPIAVPA